MIAIIPTYLIFGFIVDFDIISNIYSIITLLVSLGIILYDKLTTLKPELSMDDPFQDKSDEEFIGKSGLVEGRKDIHIYFIKLINTGFKIASNCKVRLAIFNSKNEKLLSLSPLSTRDNKYKFSINAQTSEEIFLYSHYPDHPVNSVYFYPFAYKKISKNPFNDQIYYIQLEASADEIQEPIVKCYKIENSMPLKFTPTECDLLMNFEGETRN